MIKKYQKFLEEIKISKNLTTEEAFSEFIEQLRECGDHYGQELRQFSHSYSDSAQNKVKNFDPEEDFKLVNDYMSKRGFDLETVQALAEEYGRDSFNIRIEDLNPSRCAPIDYYLYMITEKTFPLQGYEWNFGKDGSMGGDILDNEYLIRFGYGWHNTKYGKLCIEQNLGSVNNFIKKVLEFIPSYILNKFINNNKYKLFKSIYGGDYIDFVKSFMDVFLFMDDSYYVHLDELYDICKPHFNYEISLDKFYDLILTAIEDLKRGEDFKINVTRRGDEFRIST
jgi:hypothetical protein